MKPSQLWAPGELRGNLGACGHIDDKPEAVVPEHVRELEPCGMGLDDIRRAVQQDEPHDAAPDIDALLGRVSGGKTLDDRTIGGPSGSRVT